MNHFILSICLVTMCSILVNGSPTIVPISEPSISLSGNGKSAELITLGSGLAIFNMTHDGSKNFEIILLDSEGYVVNYLVHEYSFSEGSKVSFNGSKVVGIDKGGLFALDIDADGNWTVNIVQPVTTS